MGRLIRVHPGSASWVEPSSRAPAVTQCGEWAAQRNGSRSEASWGAAGAYWYGSMPAAWTRPSQM